MLVITIALILLIVIFIAVIAVAVAVYLSSSRSTDLESGKFDHTFDIKKADTIRETERPAPTPEPEHELASFASSDTVKEDYSAGVIEDLHASFSSQATVDSMGDASVRADESDEEGEDTPD